MGNKLFGGLEVNKICSSIILCLPIQIFSASLRVSAQESAFAINNKFDLKIQFLVHGQLTFWWTRSPTVQQSKPYRALRLSLLKYLNIQ